MIARTKHFVENALNDMKSGPSLADKLALAVSSAGRLTTVLLNGSSAHLFGMKRDLVPNNVFLYRDVRITNEDGVFVCRKRTSDYAVVRRDYERALREHFILDDGVFLDVGAHIGKYTVMLGRRLGSRGRVIAIEADPDNFAALQRNVEENGLTNVTALNVAAADRDHPVTLYRDPCEPIKHSLQRGNDLDERDSVTILGRSIDSVLAEVCITEVHLVKLDVEGVEMEVLTGARETLQRSPNVRVILEADTEGPLAFLRQLGFQIRRTEHRYGENHYYHVAEKQPTAGIANA
jgi:FkbM family methyltransferase